MLSSLAACSARGEPIGPEPRSTNDLTRPGAQDGAVILVQEVTAPCLSVGETAPVASQPPTIGYAATAPISGLSAANFVSAVAIQALPKAPPCEDDLCRIILPPWDSVGTTSPVRFSSDWTKAWAVCSGPDTGANQVIFRYAFTQ
jgi:hypothetical protein